MKIFEATSTINETVVKEIEKYIISTNSIKIFVVLPLLCVVIAYQLVMLDHPNYVWAIIALLVGILIPIIYVISIKKGMATAMARLREEGFSEMLSAITFTEDNIKIHNITSGATINYEYSSVAKVAETENLIAMFTKANQLIVINKKSLIEAEKCEDFLRFIKSKCKLKK
jgi:hypothetical protein